MTTRPEAEGFERVSETVPPPGELRQAVLVDGTSLCVGNADGDVFAVQDTCTHSGFPLSEGSLLPGGVLQCSWHGARFDCHTGVALQEPAFDPLERFDVRIFGGSVWARRAR